MPPVPGGGALIGKGKTAHGEDWLPRYASLTNLEQVAEITTDHGPDQLSLVRPPCHK